ncbi:hypothetical protein PCASD_05336 [Puccinia coronata f. sp. avenae]|uniref:Uncharacterized protein n=1 Tax=Puccinia coronata f. sp. avenae TaxID=200324 RepID=A0A2N5UN91_9BASI|nr:hypothetical protein PCASD_05336 [Puccinia coronata f. sp. avenae]
MVGTSMEDNNNALIILERIHQLQKTHDEQLVNSGGYFNNLNAHNKDREKKLVLLWSAKSALFKKAVDIQSELQPLKNSKSRGDRLGTRLKEKIFAALNRRKAGVSNAIKTFCNQRCEYLKKFAPELVNLPENQPFDYKTFLTMTLDDPIWNDGFLCTSQEPWAVDPTVWSGIHAVLALDRASEEIECITIDLQHALSWGVYHYQQLTQYHENDDIVCLAAKELGGHSAAGFRMGTTILQGEIERALNQHRLLLLSWHHSILALLSKKLTNRSDLPGCWFDLLEILVMNVHTGSTGNIDEDMEIVELDDGDSDGESVGVAVLDDYKDENDEERAATAPV